MNRREFLVNGFKGALLGFAVVSGIDTVAKIIEPTEAQRTRFAEDVELWDIVFINEEVGNGEYEDKVWFVTGFNKISGKIELRSAEKGVQPPIIEKAQGILLKNQHQEGSQNPKEYAHEEELREWPIVDLTKFTFLV